MKSLYESLLDDEDDVVDKLNMKPLIEEWLKKYGIKNYKINKDNTINHDGRYGINLSLYKEKEFPPYIQFGIVKGDFNISNSKLETLRGCPKKVGEYFYCTYCDSLKTLEGAPKEVGLNFYCSDCDSLKTLEGAPEKVGGSFICSYCNSLKTLEGAPKEVGENFVCLDCKKLNVTKEDIKKICEVRKNIYI